MKIKLKSLGLPSTTGLVYQPLSSSSGTDWENYPSNIDELYWQETDGRVAGEMLGVERWVWIPYRSIPVEPARNDYLVIDDIRYEVLEIKKEIYSEFEDHYHMFIKDTND